MRKIYIQSSIVALCLAMSSAVFAQDTVTVEEGLGTLEEAILTHKGDVVYKLKAGSLYILESIIEVNDVTLGDGKGLVIVGEETDGMPAVIQVGVEENRSAFPVLFNVYNNLTIRNVFLNTQNSYGNIGDGVLSFNDKVKVIMDKCVIDPAGETTTPLGVEIRQTAPYSI